MNEVDVSAGDLEPPSWLPELREYCLRVLDELGLHNHELSVLLIDRSGIRSLNRAYRGVDDTTDVLSFPQEDAESPQGRATVLGDLVVCPAVVAEGAAEAGIGFEEELHRVAIHGVLHLLGMDHRDDDGMLQYQEELLSRVREKRLGR